MVDEEDRDDGRVHEVADPEDHGRHEHATVAAVGPDVASDDVDRPARGSRDGVVPHAEDGDRADEGDQSRSGEDERRGDDVDERASDRRSGDARDRRANADVGHGFRALAIGIDPLHQPRVRADVRDGDDKRDDRRRREHEGRRRDEDPDEEDDARGRRRGRDDPDRRQTREQVGEERGEQMADERRRDDERDVGGAPAHPPHDDGHERDDDRDVHAGAEGASRVDPEVAAHACGCPVAFHTRD